jgi:hypothetical protein
MTHLAQIAAFLTSPGSPSTPGLPLGGAIIWWIICSRRKQHSIGGWLLFYFWQIFSGAVISVALVAGLAYKSYMPESFDKLSDYGLFLLSAAPSVVLLLVQAAICVLLLYTRSWEVLKLLRVVAAIDVVFEWLGVLIDASRFPDDLALSLYSAIPMTIWLVYLFSSERVKRVFKYDNWEQVTPAPTLGLP